MLGKLRYQYNLTFYVDSTKVALSQRVMGPHIHPLRWGLRGSVRTGDRGDLLRSGDPVLQAVGAVGGRRDLERFLHNGAQCGANSEY